MLQKSLQINKYIQLKINFLTNKKMSIISNAIIATTEVGKPIAECPNCLGVYEDESNVLCIVESDKCWNCIEVNAGYAF